MDFEDFGFGELVIVALVAIAVAIFVFMASPPRSNVRIQDPPPAPELVQRLVAALKEKNAKLYGASWCGYTVKQLNEIGGTHGVEYVDCATEENRQLCQDEGITAYPTWVIDGTQHSGYYNAETLLQMVR